MANQNKTKKGNFIGRNRLQAVSALVIFIGMLIKMIFLRSRIEAVGTGFYLTVLTLVMTITMLLANTLREAVKKAVFYRKSRGQYKNALKIMNTGAVIGAAAGIVIALILLFTAGRMTAVRLHLGPYGTFPMVVLAASIPFLLSGYGILGCFDGFSFEVADGAAKIIFGISDLLFSLVLVFLACGMGKVHSGLLHDDYVVYSFGATGAAAGFSGACFVAFIWLIFLFRVFRKRMQSLVNQDTSRSLETFFEQAAGLFGACGISFTRFLVLSGTFFINLIFFFKNLKTLDASTQFGIYLSENLLWFLLPVFFTFILGSFTHDYLEKIMKKEDIYHAGMRIVMGVKQYLCCVLPMFVICGIIYPALNESFYKSTVTSPNLPALLFAVLFGAGLLLCGMLKGIGNEWIGTICGAAAFVAQTVFVIVLFSKKCDLSALLYGNLIFALVFFAGCAFFVGRFCVYKKHLSTNLLMPIVALLALVLSAVLCMLLKDAIGNIPAVAAAILLSCIIHAVTLVILGCVREGELNDFPQGGLLRFAGRLLGIYS